MSAIRKSLLIAMQIQQTNPEIRERYIAGESQGRIAESLGVENYSKTSLGNSVGYALRGHEGGFDVEPFLGLITDKNHLERLAIDHNVESGRQLHKDGKGVHGVPMEIRREYSRRAGKEAGRRSRAGEVNLGAAALPIEGRVEFSRNGIRARGQVPWEDLYSEELGLSAEEHALQLTRSPNYVYSTGGNKGKIMWKAVAEEMSVRFSHKFSRHAVYARLIGNKKRR